MNIAAIILAAGTSSRMPGRNKLLLPWSGKTVIECTVDSLLQSSVHEIIVVLGFEAEKIRAAMRERKVSFVTNPDYAQGMSTSIVAGVMTVSNEAQGILISLGDLPLVTASDLGLLISAFEQAPRATIVVPVFQGQRGNPVIFHARHKAEMLELRGDIGCKSLLTRHSRRVVEVEMANDHVVRDLDTPEAFAALSGYAQHQIPIGG
ncbi:MAG: nucleotidyltransferase family protein [bacterium]